jgi:hypothetical protein
MKQQISYKMDGGLNAGQTVLTEFQELPVIYDKVIFQDLEEKIISKRWSFEEYENHVTTTLGNSYKGMNKTLYGKAVEALKTIVYARIQHKRGSETKEAISFLHQDIKLSPVTIHGILLLFGVKISTAKILELSNETFYDKAQPSWMNAVLGGESQW